jgi:predicted ATPase/DNA-binding winged helix-turn-helix (wHTH) protein
MADAADSPQTIEFGRFTVIRHRRELLVDGRATEVGGRAFDTLLALLDAHGAVLSKDELMSRVWPDRVVEENNLHGQISELRKVFGAERDLIRTVAGRGYQFTGALRVVAATPAPPPVANLPQRTSELIGRETCLDEVVKLVRAHRLVSLVGPGGIGKTRLGIEAARQLLPEFADGVGLAKLGPLTDAHLVPMTVATALGVIPPTGAVSVERVAAALGGRRVLLVLDNCEHLIEAAARMAEALLRASPTTYVIATSREPLRVSGEQRYRVPPLDVPTEDNTVAEDVLRHGAVKLFVTRARAVEPRYVSEIQTGPATAAALCRRLDGIPLAIELAAARIAAFGVEGVAARLDDRFRILTGGLRTALPHQQTLRATLDWSYELLPTSERVVLRRLAVFVGGFTLEAASEVAASPDLSPDAVVAALANLVAKSLVSVDLAGARAVYRLLETTRAYVREKLIGSAEFDHVARRHAEYYRDLFQHADAELETLPNPEWLVAYRPHIDDLRTALDWAFSPSGDVGVGVALTAATVPLWTQLSLLIECRARVEQAIAGLGRQVAGDPGRDMRLYLALGHAILHTRASGGPEMSAAFTKALELADVMDDTRYRLGAIFGLYAYRLTTGEYRDALSLAEKFRTVATETADRSEVPIGSRLIGLALHILGDQPGARRHLEPLVRSRVVTARSSHIILYQYDQRVLLDCYYARVLLLQGFGDQARRLTESLVDYVRTRDHVLSFLYALLIAACPIALYVGDLTTAEHHVRLAFDLAARHALEVWNAWAQCFEGAVLIKRGDHGAGSQLLQSALERLPEPAVHHHISLLLAELAAGLGGAGQIAEGLGVVDKALARAEQTEAGWYLAELLRTKGELLLLERVPSAVATAEACFQQALDVARRQGALSWELRAATSLARFWRGQERVTQARKLLGPVYRRFTEGFETADLIAAKALLDSVR